MSPPVVLVNGYSAPRASMRWIEADLRQRGLRAYSAHLLPLCLQDVRRLADRLDHEVDRVLTLEGAAHCDVVGVSQGGLVGAWWTKSLARGRVRRLVMVGAPIQGTWAALWGVPLVGLVSRGLWQMMPASPVRQRLVRGSWPADVEVTTIASAGDPIAPPHLCAVAGAREVRLDGPDGPLGHQRLVVDPGIRRAIADTLLGG